MDENNEQQRPAGGTSGGAPRETGGDSGDLGEAGRRLGREGGPVGLRVGRDPGNLGDEIPDRGDVTYPAPDVGDKPNM